LKQNNMQTTWNQIIVFKQWRLLRVSNFVLASSPGIPEFSADQ
jgi:hypothetical protein